MNWLAHLRLSPPQPPLLRLGNLAGDFVRGVELGALAPELRRGVAMHRAVDAFVDAHPVVRRARARLQPPFRRFGGVLLDVWFDHFLARDWAAHGDGTGLADFLDGVHADLRAWHDALPAPLQRVSPRFQRDGWLLGYSSIEGVARVLGLMAQRLGRPSPLADGSEPLRADYERLAADFAALWPEVAAFARSHADARTS